MVKMGPNSDREVGNGKGGIQAQAARVDVNFEAAKKVVRLKVV
jgi:hypothetical protein